jgi:hypothetical protein
MSPNKAKKKNITLNDLGAMIEHVVKSMADFATKEDIADLRKDMATKADIKKLDDRLAGVESKVAGIDRRLDAEAMRRDDEKIPARIGKIEKHLGLDKQVRA